MKKYLPETMTILFIVAFVLKMTGFSVSWLLVFAPIYGPVMIAFVYAIEKAVYGVMREEIKDVEDRNNTI